LVAVATSLAVYVRACLMARDDCSWFTLNHNRFFGAIASRSVSRGVLEKPSQSGVLQFKFEIACAHFRKTRELGH
jgi:hypothetical protein